MTDIFVRLEESDFKSIIRQYHLPETDYELLQSMTNDLRSKLKCKLNYLILDYTGYGVITLGPEYDHYQENWNQKGRLYETLLLEYVGAEMLNKCYEVCSDIITEKTGLYVKEYRFPGAELPIQMISEICDSCGESFVTYNKAYAMLPKKSVAFQMLFTNQEKERFCHICSSCNKTSCLNRKSK